MASELGVFVRWAPKSSLYIYHHVRHFVRCAVCPLDEFGRSFDTPKLAEMLEHVRRHKLAGHQFPSSLPDVLSSEWPQYLR